MRLGPQRRRAHQRPAPRLRAPRKQTVEEPQPVPFDPAIVLPSQIRGAEAGTARRHDDLDLPAWRRRERGERMRDVQDEQLRDAVLPLAGKVLGVIRVREQAPSVAELVPLDRRMKARGNDRQVRRRPISRLGSAQLREKEQRQQRRRQHVDLHRLLPAFGRLLERARHQSCVQQGDVQALDFAVHAPRERRHAGEAVHVELPDVDACGGGVAVAAGDFFFGLVALVEIAYG